LAERNALTERAIKVAQVLRPLGTKPLSMQQARVASKLLNVHWTSVYRLRRRFIANPVASSVAPNARGPKVGGTRLDAKAEEVLDDVLRIWLPRQRELAHPLLDLWTEVKRRCQRSKIKPPARSTVARRWARHREEQAAVLAQAPGAQIAPGSFVATRPLEIVQIDHTQSDAFVVDPWFRRAIGRPWLTLAIDVATRCVVGFYLGMERPNAATVALVLSRIALPKAAWLAAIGAEAHWPMQGIPQVLHLDNAAEFKSRALRSGCAQYGVELMYRPVGRPHFGGHIERLNRTLMQRLKALPGATGNSVKGRKARKPEETAALTLTELEQWLALEIAQHYHQSEHRGLMDATPAGAWEALASASPPRQLPLGPDEAMNWLIRFMPLAPRTIQGDGLTIFRIRYWHPIFAAWRETRKQVLVRYHPEDISRIFISTNGKNYVEVGYADVRRPRISLWEQRAICRILRAQGQRQISEAMIFKAIEQQREIVARARSETRRQRREFPAAKRAPTGVPWTPAPAQSPEVVDYSGPPKPVQVELWR